MLRVLRHADLIDLAAGWIDAHQGPDGSLEGHPALADAVRDWEAGHADSGDYLEKG